MTMLWLAFFGGCVCGLLLCGGFCVWLAWGERQLEDEIAGPRPIDEATGDEPVVTTTRDEKTKITVTTMWDD